MVRGRNPGARVVASFISLAPPHASGLDHFAHRSDCFSARQLRQPFTSRAVEWQKATLTVISFSHKVHGLCGNPMCAPRGFARSGIVLCCGEAAWCGGEARGARVVASSISLAPPRASGLAHYAAPPLPTKSVDFVGLLCAHPSAALARRTWRQLRCRPGFANR